ncbi:MAG: hypothetical protein NC313_17390 [Butyrivibrio sp.]|nr:hypothetical protein [Butyrivibrio sp.]
MGDKYSFPIKKCPKCGGTVFTVGQRISGYGEYYVDMETGEVESTELHQGLTYKNVRKYAICTDCGKRLFKIDDNLNVIE